MRSNEKKQAPVQAVGIPDTPDGDRITAATSDVIGIMHVIRFGRHVWVRLGLALGLIVLSSASVMIAARVLGWLVEALVKSPDGTVRLAVMFLALESFAVLTQYIGRVSLARATIEIAYGIRMELFRKMNQLPISYFDAQPLGRTITRLTNDVEGVEGFFNGTLARVLVASIHICTVLVAMVVADTTFGPMVVACAIPALLFTVALRKPVRFWLRAYKKRSAQINARLAEYLNGVSVIRIFGLERWSLATYKEVADSQLRAGLNTMHWNSFIRPMTVLLCSVPTLIVVLVGGTRVLEGAMELGLLVAFVRYSERFISPVRTIAQEIQNIQEALVSSERVRRMLLEPDEKDVLGADGTLRPDIGGQVSYEHVGMSYSENQPVLKDVTFAVEPGMTVGLVGMTGSGKSTTVNLLPRLYPYQSGVVRLDGIDITDIARDHLRAAIGYVSQDVVIFSGSMRENLAAASHDLTDDVIMAACRQTGLAEVLASFADGLDFRVAENGENLSMGERQLIAFTRMLLKNPRIMILDEATANIDERCEVLIQKAVARVMKGRTCFVIAHRLSTIIQCDLILVFRDGRIIERGTHAELMASGGYYAGLASRQLKGVPVESAVLIPEAAETGRSIDG
jgi:ABC-type multidrug transport system fused ATPase/permease subunit